MTEPKTSPSPDTQRAIRNASEPPAVSVHPDAIGVLERARERTSTDADAQRLDELTALVRGIVRRQDEWEETTEARLQRIPAPQTVRLEVSTVKHNSEPPTSSRRALDTVRRRWKLLTGIAAPLATFAASMLSHDMRVAIAGLLRAIADALAPGQ